MAEKITSFQNPRIKLIKKLRDKKGREREGRFVIDDTRDLLRALACGYQVDYALYCPALLDAPLLPELMQTPLYEVPRELMENVNYRSNPAPYLAVMITPAPLGLEALRAAPIAPVLGLVNLEKPGNIGALLRTADATGFKTVLLIDTALDLYNPNLIRSSTGACFLNNVYAISSQEAIRFLTENAYQIVATHLMGDRNLFEVELSPRCAVIMGTEDVGLDARWVEQANLLVKIPMMGTLSDSLNVSVSGAIFMYEALRQRSF